MGNNQSFGMGFASLFSKGAIMGFSAFILYAVIFGIGVLVGINLRNCYAEEKEKRTFYQISEEVRNRLKTAEELNKSLLSDLAFAKRKFSALNNSMPSSAEDLLGTKIVR